MKRQRHLKRFFKGQKGNNKFHLIKIQTINSLMIFILLCSLCSCKKDNNSVKKEESVFILSSPEIGTDSLLPAEYTCDGESATLPLEWSGFPQSTVCFALIMHHEASQADIHWYWVMYNIPLSINSLPRNVNGIGTLGNNSVNGNIGYAPPCSQGPGPKKYIFTIYALSASIELSIPNTEVSREVLLQAIKDITLASATLTVIYSRNIQMVLDMKEVTNNISISTNK
jgi:Raf kinase inhibitor-like YbhB/YbcL family protein